MAISRAICGSLLLVLLLGVAEAVKIETFNGLNCQGGATNEFFVGRNQCQTFIDQGSVRISEIESNVRVSFHNQRNCETASSVGQGHGEQCRNQGGTKIRAVFVA